MRSLIGDTTGEAVLSAPPLGELMALAEDDYERGRLEQFLVESLMLVPAGAAAIAAADEQVGEVLEHSHALAHRKLGNQVPLTNAMVGLAQQMGAIGASAFGAGWGGSVYALVPRGDAEDFAAAWLAEYRRLDGAPESAMTLVTRPGASAQRL